MRSPRQIKKAKSTVGLDDPNLKDLRRYKWMMDTEKQDMVDKWAKNAAKDYRFKNTHDMVCDKTCDTGGVGASASCAGGATSSSASALVPAVVPVAKGPVIKTAKEIKASEQKLSESQSALAKLFGMKALVK